MKTFGLIIALLLAASVATVTAADVEANWNKHCASCHGKDGKGETKAGKKAGVKDYTDAKVQAEMKDDKAFTSVKEGQKEGDKVLMKPYGKSLTDEEIKALIAHVRKFKK